jgi:hypothetical protein
MTPEAAVQWLIYFHPKWGETSQWKIKCDAAPTARAATELFS